MSVAFSSHGPTARSRGMTWPQSPARPPPQRMGGPLVPLSSQLPGPGVPSMGAAEVRAPRRNAVALGRARSAAHISALEEWAVPLSSADGSARAVDLSPSGSIWRRLSNLLFRVVPAPRQDSAPVRSGLPRRNPRGTGISAALRAGARGYLVKGAPGERIVGAVRAVAGGEVVFDADVASNVLGQLANKSRGARTGPFRRSPSESSRSCNSSRPDAPTPTSPEHSSCPTRPSATTCPTSSPSSASPIERRRSSGRDKRALAELRVLVASAVALAPRERIPGSSLDIGRKLTLRSLAVQARDVVADAQSAEPVQ